MQKFKEKIMVFLAIIIVFIFSPPHVSAYTTPSADRYDFAVTDIKILSDSPYREENPFKIGITVTYNATNYGYLEEQPDRWVDCPKCGGGGYITVGGTETCSACGGKDTTMEKTTFYCSAGKGPEQPKGRRKCRPECDGYDYLCQLCGSLYSNNNGGYQGYCNKSGCKGKIIRDHDCDCYYDDVGPVRCPTCNGSGKVGENAHDVECPGCHGEGGKYVPVPPIWIPPTRPSEGHTQLSFTIDGLNQDYAIQDITVPIDGESVDTSRNGDGWSVWGSAYYEIELNAGENIGNKNVEARINWDYKNREINSNNNSKSTNIDVIPATNLQVEFIPPNAKYRTDTDIITTFMIHNKDNIGELNIRPKHNLTARFTAISAKNDTVIYTAENSGIVIPKKGSNITYFKWHVPKDYKESDIKLQCDINTTKVPSSVGIPGVNEMDYTDNTVIGENAVQQNSIMETPDTIFENRPAWFTEPNNTDTVHYETFSDEIKPSTTFKEWIWADNWYKKATYTLELTSELQIEPDIKNPTAKEKNDLWEVKSGYGLSLKNSFHMNNIGSMLAPLKSFTVPQSGSAHLPEYRYSSSPYKYRSLEKTSNEMMEIYKNKYAMNDKGESEYRRVHFVPLWYPDSEYVIKTYIYDCWTPAGMLSVISDDKVMIKGNMYQDWYVTHSKKNDR